MKKLKLVLLLLLAVLSISSCAKEPKKYEGSFLFLFNTVTEVFAYSKSKD